MSTDTSAEVTTSSDGEPVDDVAILPTWLDEMLKPGVGPGVFKTLKLSLLSLIVILCFMLYNIEDEQIQFHLRIYLGMTLILTALVVWFINELNKSKLEEERESKKE
uniref:Transmembrane protein n=1 Tax=Prymnesium polylepis TaxID=72548 RepID=A0A6V4V666_9EUKA|mmetsp:Transcript_69911/g.191845  ORF Transcript_69911/g.191845 Transcript_69911/m.191845 type:complete len:107 (-) Transcript_69911:257-577(-)